MIYTRCSKCHSTYPQGGYCPKCSKKNQNYNKKRGPETKFYQSKAWKQTKAEVIRYYNSIDIYLLGLTGMLVPAARPLVHHIVEYRKDKSLALSFDNLVPVSSSSHNLIHQLYDSGRREDAVDTIRLGIQIFEDLKRGNFDENS